MAFKQTFFVFFLPLLLVFWLFFFWQSVYIEHPLYQCSSTYKILRDHPIYKCQTITQWKCTIHHKSKLFGFTSWKKFGFSGKKLCTISITRLTRFALSAPLIPLIKWNIKFLPCIILAWKNEQELYSIILKKS